MLRSACVAVRQPQHMYVDNLGMSPPQVTGEARRNGILWLSQKTALPTSGAKRSAA